MFEYAPAEPQAACGRRDPHALDLTPPGMTLERAAAYGFSLERREYEIASRPGHVGKRCRNAFVWIKSRLEPPRQLCEVVREAVLGRATARIDHLQVDCADAQQPFHRFHRCRELGPPRL